VSDAPGTERLAVVSIDSLVSGSLAGELLSRFVQGNGKVAMITGDLGITDHSEKYSSFQSAIRSLFPAMHILEPIENHEDETEAYEKAINLLEEHPDLKGLYVSTANSEPVLKALEDSGALKKITVITTDLFPALVKYIESGAVIASIYQRPKSQGLMAFRLMHDFLVKGQCPSHQMKLAPHLVMKSNLGFFLNRMPLDSEFQETGSLEASTG
jgi:LacI family transcriptional regulator